jgi:hypothetical protein
LVLATAVAGVALALSALVAQHSSADAPTTARLTIAAVGADMEFRTLGGIDPAFTVLNGQRRVFRRLPPGRYVVVQAPPVVTVGLRIQCSDGVSSNQYDLQAGDALTCTFSVE